MDLLEQWYWVMPNVVLYDTELTPNQKLIYVVISSLCAEKGYCRASNNYIGKLLGIKTTATSEAINKLVEKWYLISEIDKKWGNKRVLTLCRKNGIPITEKWKTYNGKVKDINTIDNYKWINSLGMDDLNNFVEQWNSIETIQTKQWKVKGFRKCIKVSWDLQDERKKVIKKYDKEQLILWVNNYINEIKERKKDNGYYEHRFTLYEFIKQWNWLKKFINV